MVPFQACVEGASGSGLMCSYNSVNGVPSCANDWLLTTVARENWGFDGYITSDCDADANVDTTHHYEKAREEAIRDVLHAGNATDISQSWHMIPMAFSIVLPPKEHGIASERVLHCLQRTIDLPPKG